MNVGAAVILFVFLPGKGAMNSDESEPFRVQVASGLDALKAKNARRSDRKIGQENLSVDVRTGMLADSSGNLWFQAPVEWISEFLFVYRATLDAGTEITDNVAAGLFLNSVERGDVNVILSKLSRKVIDLERSLALYADMEDGTTVITFPAWGSEGEKIVEWLRTELGLAVGEARAAALTTLLLKGEWFALKDGTTSFRKYFRDTKEAVDMVRGDKRVAVIIASDDNLRKRFSHLFELSE